MSSMVLDKSLDSIISENKKNRRTGRPRHAGGKSAKSKLLGTGGSAPAVSKRKAVAAAPAGAKATLATAGNTVADKIIVSNLPLDVNEGQVKDLFASTVGPVRTTLLQYNAQGKSSGVATVIFQKQGDAKKAFDAYNNRLIDGKRPMKIEIVFDPAKQPLVNRVAAAKTATAAAPTKKVAGRKPRRGAKRPAKSAADLDAEMADYTKAGTAA